MAQAKLSKAQATSINLARSHSSDKERKAVKTEIFKSIKEQFGIPDSTKLRVETADHTHAQFLVLRDASNDQPFELGDDGRWVGASPSTTIAVGVRWFELPIARAMDALTDEVMYGGTDELTFDAGLSTPPDGGVRSGDALVVKGDKAYIRIPELAF
jgi:hypothetical protein